MSDDLRKEMTVLIAKWSGQAEAANLRGDREQERYYHGLAGGLQIARDELAEVFVRLGAKSGDVAQSG